MGFLSNDEPAVSDTVAGLSIALFDGALFCELLALQLDSQVCFLQLVSLIPNAVICYESSSLPEEM
ncbi:hypothetical protein C0J52_02091 [Blattella germanica]|nr:hypothetical protein C0J52_02091 [Blattella germanica]